MIANAQNLIPAANAIDHLLLGAPDLDRGIAWLEERTGVKAVIGGVHPGRGTRNALVALGGRRYLEVIAPDPAQSVYNFHIDVRQLVEPRLINWAASTNNIEATAARARAAGLQVAGPQDGSRQTPSGRVLRWRTLNIVSDLGGNSIEPMPFFIQWAPDSPHPSQDSPAGCELQSFQFAHTNSSALAGALEGLGIFARITQTASVRLTATLRTPKGIVEIG